MTFWTSYQVLFFFFFVVFSATNVCNANENNNNNNNNGGTDTSDGNGHMGPPYNGMEEGSGNGGTGTSGTGTGIGGTFNGMHESTTALPNTPLPTAPPTPAPTVPSTTNSTTSDPPTPGPTSGPTLEPTSSPTPNNNNTSSGESSSMDNNNPADNNNNNVRMSNVMTCPMNVADRTSGCTCNDGNCDMRECTRSCSCIGGNCCMSAECANADAHCQCFGSECTFGDKDCVHADTITSTGEGEIDDGTAEGGGGTSGFIVPEITPAPITDPPIPSPPPTQLPTTTPPVNLPPVPKFFPPTIQQPTEPPAAPPTSAPMQLTSGGGGGSTTSNNNQNFMDCPENPSETSDCFCIQGSCDMRECTFSCNCQGGNCCLSSECQSDPAALCDCPTNDCTYGATEEDCFAALVAGLASTGSGSGGDDTNSDGNNTAPAPTPLIRYPTPDEAEVQEEINEERAAMERRNLIIGIVSCSVVFLLAGYCCYTTMKEDSNKKKAWGFNRPGRATHNDKAPLI